MGIRLKFEMPFYDELGGSSFRWNDDELLGLSIELRDMKIDAREVPAFAGIMMSY